MQIDLVPELPPSVSCRKHRYSWKMCFPDICLSNLPQTKTLKLLLVIIDMLTKRAYLTTKIISNKGPVFVSRVIQEVPNAIRISLEHTTTRHAQTIGMLERIHASLMKALKVETEEQRPMWHKCVNVAVLNYNTL